MSAYIEGKEMGGIDDAQGFVVRILMLLFMTSWSKLVEQEATGPVKHFQESSIQATSK